MADYKKMDARTIKTSPIGGDAAVRGGAKIAPSRHAKNMVGQQHITKPIEKGRLGGRAY